MFGLSFSMVFRWAAIAQIVAALEVIAITWILSRYTRNIPSFWHARRYHEKISTDFADNTD